MTQGLRVNSLSFKVGVFEEGPVSFTVADGEYFVLMGKTGSGKSLLLKALCGFIKTGRDEIMLHGTSIGCQPVSRRAIGYVPQGSYLFPHMKVIDNITFSLKTRGVGSEACVEKVKELIELLGIGELLERKPQTLSGGERQKVALARALASKPRLLILDEPVSALDEPSRREICNVLKEIHDHYRITTIHVCHSKEECRTMADRVGVMDNGKLVQTGRFEELLSQPAHKAVKLLMNL